MRLRGVALLMGLVGEVRLGRRRVAGVGVGSATVIDCVANVVRMGVGRDVVRAET